MTSEDSQRALRPAEPERGMLVHTTADRRVATEHWLLSTLDKPERRRARAEWADGRVTLLPLGGLFSAVRIPAPLLHALAASRQPDDIDAFLDDALDGGPVICDLHQARYYALVPATMPTTWRQAAHDWRSHDVDCLGRGTHLGVPPLNATTWSGPNCSYWSVPMPAMAMLCAPLTVARLIAAGSHQLAEQGAVEGGGRFGGSGMSPGHRS